MMEPPTSYTYYDLTLGVIVHDTVIVTYLYAYTPVPTPAPIPSLAPTPTSAPALEVLVLEDSTSFSLPPEFLAPLPLEFDPTPEPLIPPEPVISISSDDSLPDSSVPSYHPSEDNDDDEEMEEEEDPSKEPIPVYGLEEEEEEEEENPSEESIPMYDLEEEKEEPSIYNSIGESHVGSYHFCTTRRYHGECQCALGRTFSDGSTRESHTCPHWVPCGQSVGGSHTRNFCQMWTYL